MNKWTIYCGIFAWLHNKHFIITTA